MFLRITYDGLTQEWTVTIAGPDQFIFYQREHLNEDEALQIFDVAKTILRYMRLMYE